MANKRFSLNNRGAEMPSNESVYPQINDIVANGSNYQRDHWMSCPSTGLAMFSQTSHVATSPHLAISKPSHITPQPFTNQRTIPYINTMSAPMDFGMHIDSNIDESVLENGEAFTSYTGMDSQTASRTTSWY